LATNSKGGSKMSAHIKTMLLRNKLGLVNFYLNKTGGVA